MQVCYGVARKAEENYSEFLSLFFLWVQSLWAWLSGAVKRLAMLNRETEMPMQVVVVEVVAAVALLTVVEAMQAVEMAVVVVLLAAVVAVVEVVAAVVAAVVETKKISLYLVEREI